MNRMAERRTLTRSFLSSFFSSILFFSLFSSFLLVLFSLPASAFLLSPASTSLTAEPGNTYPFTLTVTNDQETTIAVNVTADALSSALSFEPSSFTIAPGENRDVIVTFTAADDLAPGRNDGRILVTASAAVVNQFGSAVTLVHTIHAYRAYAGAFLVATLHLPTAASLPILVSLENKGEAATSVTGNVSVRGADGSLFSDTALPAVTLAGRSTTKETATLPPLDDGEYLIAATLAYDDPLSGTAIVKDSLRFIVGTPAVTIGAPSGTLDPRGVSLLTVPVTLAWNTPRKLVATAETAGRRGQAAIPVLVDPATPTTLKAYIETAGLAAATYDVHIMVHDEAGQLLGEATFPVETAFSAPSKTLPQAYMWLVALLLVLFILATILWRHHRE